MKWFKHETNAHADAKLKRLKMRYGLEGLGLYWYCLELIGQTVEPHNLTFELEHDSEVIANDLNIHVDHIQEMMRYMIELGLFEQNGVLVTCLKMAIRADEYTQKALKKALKMVPMSRQCPDNIPTISRQTRDKVRSNRKKERKKDIYTSEFENFWKKYPSRNKGNKKQAAKVYERLNSTDKEKALNKLAVFFEFNKETNPDYFLHGSTYINNRRWEDETPLNKKASGASFAAEGGL